MAVTGAQAVQQQFDQLVVGIEGDCRAIVAATVARVHRRAYELCPYGAEPGPFPGHLRDQIRSQMSRDHPQGAVWVERRGIGGFWGTDNVGIWAEYGTVRWPEGHPFLRPASEPERATFMANLEAALLRQASRV